MVASEGIGICDTAIASFLYRCRRSEHVVLLAVRKDTNDDRRERC